MKKNIFLISVLFSFIYLSCTKPEEPKIVIKKAIDILENANTISYDVASISKTAFIKDTIFANSHFKFKKVEYDPYIGFNFTRKSDSTLNMYYKTLELFNIDKKEKIVTSYDFQDKPSIGVLSKYGGEQESYAGIVKVLKDFQNENTIKFIGKEKVNGKLTYNYTASSKKNLANMVNHFWVDPETYHIVKLKTVKTVFKDKKPDYTFFICDFSNITFNEHIDDSVFVPHYDETYKVVKKEYLGTDTPTILAAGNKAPEWTLKNLVEKDVSSNYLGKYTFLECWKSACDYCVESFKEMDELIELFEPKVNFVTVNFDKNSYDTNLSMKHYTIKYPVLKATDEFKKDYQINVYPSYFIIDKKGNIIYSKYGRIKDNRKEIDSILKTLK